MLLPFNRLVCLPLGELKWEMLNQVAGSVSCAAVTGVLNSSIMKKEVMPMEQETLGKE